jgi:hypothetical protein
MPFDGERAADYTVVVNPSVRKVAGVRGVITRMPFSLLWS